jgi:hypothetical protein
MKSILLNLWIVFSMGLLFGNNVSQIYDLTVLGIKIGEVTYSYPSKDQIIISAHSVGIIDYFFPFKNDYITTYDTLSYGLRSYKKVIHQGEFKQRVSGLWNDETGEFEYKKHDSITLPDSCMNIFIFLEKLSRTPDSLIDTQWFPLEHEGNYFKTRVLLADTDQVKLNNDSILCNHFRLDLMPENELKKMFDQTDYFSQNIIHPEAVKQIWVEKKSPGQIVKASVKSGFITVIATQKK